METAEIVKVAVSAAPYSIDRPFDYQIPAPLLERALPGVRVTVPFGRGNRTSEGIILARGSGEKLPGLKPLEAVLDDAPVLDSQGIALALWMRQRYFCTMFEAVKTILPAGLWYRLREIWRLADGLDRCGGSVRSDEAGRRRAGCLGGPRRLRGTGDPSGVVRRRGLRHPLRHEAGGGRGL